jgi:hypothetical protein
MIETYADPLAPEYRAILTEMERQRLAGELDAAGLLALSDLYDDADDPDMAAFCRYMPDDPRIPDEDAGHYNDHSRFDWYKKEHLSSLHAKTILRSVVPLEVFELLGRDGDFIMQGTYHSRERAERDLGRVLRLIGITG